MKKTVSLEMELYFEVEDDCISWVGGRHGFVDFKTKKPLDAGDFPSTINLLIHYLAKYTEGKNGEDELAIVHDLEGGEK